MIIKTLHSVLFGLFISALSFSQTIELPFFDDFESGISNWTSINLEGNDIWHYSGDDGVDGGKCARFYVTESPLEANDDYLISPVFNNEGNKNIAIAFKYFYHGDGIIPEFYYANSFDGNLTNSDWTNIDNGFFGGMWGWNDAQIEIESPGESFVFAVRYQSSNENSVYFLLDNFNIESFTPPAPFVLVGNSDHFEFYTNITGEENFYVEIQDELESNYLNYTSLWDRPGGESVFNTDSKIKIKYCNREDISGFNMQTPLWDCGSIDLSTNTIFISPLISEVQQNYYTNLSSLSVNELSQLALAGKLNNNGDAFQGWYLEGFGLYEMGYRPNRDDLISKLNELGTNEPEIVSVTALQLLNEIGNKDLMASLFESKVLVGCYYYLSTFNDLYYWHQLLKHYYIKDIDRIQLIYSSAHFDIYGAEKEIPSIEPMGLNMEEQFEMQQNRFEVEINHRINICIYDNEVGLEINDRDDFQGLACGADKINTMPLDIGDYGLLNHEFMHILVSILSNYNLGPGQFLNEGLAESTDSFMTDEEMPSHNWIIQGLFYHYQRKYNREPAWLEIVDNTEVNEEDGYWVDAYALGKKYWRYMNDKYPDDFWIKVKLFLQGGRDWSVFGGQTTEQEGAEFIQFMKELAYVGPPLETTPLAFYEDFETDFDGWTLMRYGADDLWQNEENAGINESYCAYVVDPYWLEEKDVDSWLVTPPIDCTGEATINVRFNYKQHGQGIKPEVYYAGNFTGVVDPVDWILVEGISWDAPEGEWSEISFNIENAPDKLNIGVRYLSIEGNYTTYLIDNFNIESTTLDIESNSYDVNALKFYPNPVADILTIDSKTPLKKIIFYSISGKKLIEVNSNFEAISTKRLPKGIHFVKIFSEKTTTIKKLIKK